MPGEILPETVSAQAAVCLSQSTGGSGVHPSPLGSFDRMQGFQPGMKSRKIPTKLHFLFGGINLPFPVMASKNGMVLTTLQCSPCESCDLIS